MCSGRRVRCLDPVSDRGRERQRGVRGLGEAGQRVRRGASDTHVRGMPRAVSRAARDARSVTIDPDRDRVLRLGVVGVVARVERKHAGPLRAHLDRGGVASDGYRRVRAKPVDDLPHTRATWLVHRAERDGNHALVPARRVRRGRQHRRGVRRGCVRPRERAGRRGDLVHSHVGHVGVCELAGTAREPRAVAKAEDEMPPVVVVVERLANAGPVDEGA